MVAVYRLTRTDLEWANINAIDVSSTRPLGQEKTLAAAVPPRTNHPLRARSSRRRMYGAARIALPGEFVHPTADIGRKHVPELKPGLGLDYPDDCGGRYGGIEATATRETFRSH